MNRQIRQTEDVGASWRSGYAEDCKSLHPGSIPGEASIYSSFLQISGTACKLSFFTGVNRAGGEGT